MSQPQAQSNARIYWLAGLAVALAAVFVADRFWLSAPSASAPVAVREDRPIAMRDAEPYLPTLTEDQPILARPLFSPDRRPERTQTPRLIRTPQATPIAEPAPTTPPEFSVVGLAVDGQGSASALIRPRGGALVRVYLGERVEGWRVVEIDAEGLVLERGDARWRIPVDPVR